MSDRGDFKRLPGFRDFPPDALAERDRIFSAWRRVSRRYGFEEYDGPPLELLDLYTAKSGDEIVGQLYNFVDKGDREVALRPEMTPSLARILAERSRAMPKPIRWFSMPQLFRYERQQRGRLREHYQWNVDIVGEARVAADVDIVAVAVDGVRELGLDHRDFVARVSDRRLLGMLMEECGVAPDSMPLAFQAVDKLERAGADKTAAVLADAGLEPQAARRLVTQIEEGDLEGLRSTLGHRAGAERLLDDMQTYLADLDALGLGEYVRFDLRIVRGLAYYTGIVFELFDRKGELRAICGGGRYDRLLELVGGDPLPAVGFGMGDVVLGELLKERGLVSDEGRSVDVYVVNAMPVGRREALELAGALRATGASVLYGLHRQSVRKQLKSAASAGARQVVVLGPDEMATGRASLRNMMDGSEIEVALSELRTGGGLIGGE